MLKYLTIMIALGIMLAPHRSDSQTYGGALEGVTSVHIVVEDFSEFEARICGKRTERIHAAAALSINGSRLRLRADSPVTFYISTLPMILGTGRCAVSFEIEVWTAQGVSLKETSTFKFVKIELWNDGGIISAQAPVQRHLNA